MKRTLGLGAVLSLGLVLISPFQAAATGDDAMRILTYPTGLVVGSLQVKVDLGSEGLPAELSLDGTPACTFTAEKPQCTVDLGPDPHVHHLELRRPDGSRTDRWVNRPGQEAELELLVGSPDARQVCAARIAWAHPLKQNPAELVVTMDGRPLRITEDGHLTRFPCPPDQQPVLVASAVFPDGRRVETAAVVGAFAERTSVALASVPLVPGTLVNRNTKSKKAAPCSAVAGAWPEADTGAGRLDSESGFEVVLVLDPGASFRNLYTSGWHAGRLPTLDSGAMVGEQIFRKGHRSDEPKPKTSWRRAEATLFDASRLWYVAPDTGLHRVNGLSAGRPDWFKLLFKFGLAEIKETPRVADAVAASGLVAGAGPRRAVVLLLGNNVQQRDGSQFSPRQAREYLAEVGVPLIVLRNGKARDDGWPKGLATLNMDALADNLELVQDLVQQQCLAWIPAQQLAGLLVGGMPDGVHLAGRDGDAPESPAATWAQAELEAERAASLAEQQVAREAALAERIDVTAVRVLVSATDQDGQPLAGLTVDDLEPFEDGKPATVLALTSLAAAERMAEDSPGSEQGTTKSEQEAEPAGSLIERPLPARAAELPVAVYVDHVIGGGGDQRGALHAVEDEADRLVALGPVEIVVRELNGVRTVLEPTRDASLLSSAIDELLEGTQPRHAIETIRRDFAKRIHPIPDRVTRDQVSGGQVQTLPGAGVSFGVKTAAREEEILLRRAMQHLRLWATKGPEHQAGLLLVVGLGFDEDMGAYYQPFVDRQEPHNSSAARAALREYQQRTTVDRLGLALAGTGKRVFTIAGTIAGTPDYAAENRTIRFQEHMSASSSGALTPQTSDQLLIDPIGTQRHMAEASGGDAVLGTKGLRRALQAASGWHLLTYQVARPPDHTVHALELRSTRPGVKITTGRVVRDTTPEGQAEARSLELLAASGSEAFNTADLGDLPVTLLLGSPTVADTKLQADLQITVDLLPLVETLGQLGASPDLLVSVATVLPTSEPSVVQHQEKLDELRAGWIYTVPVEWPAETAARLAVTVQDLVTGLWGGALAELPAGP